MGPFPPGGSATRPVSGTIPEKALHRFVNSGKTGFWKRQTHKYTTLRFLISGKRLCIKKKFRKRLCANPGFRNRSRMWLCTTTGFRNRCQPQGVETEYICMSGPPAVLRRLQWMRKNANGLVCMSEGVRLHVTTVSVGEGN